MLSAKQAERQEETGRAKLALGLVLLGQMMNWLPVMGITPLLPLMQEDWQMSFSQLGFFTGLLGMTGLVASIPAGAAASRYGVKPSVLAGGACGIAGIIVVAIAGDFLVGSAGRVVWMVGYRLATVALFAASAMLTPKRLVASMMGFTFAFANSAMVVGAPLSAYTAGQLGWRAAMMVFAALSTLFCLAFLAFFPSIRGEAAGHSRHSPEIAGERSVYRNPTVWLLAALAFLNTLAIGGLSTFVPSAMIDQYGSSTSDVANVITVAYAIGIPLLIIAGVLADRVPSRKWIVAGCNIPTAVLALFLTSNDPSVFVLATVGILSLSVVSVSVVHAIPATVLSARALGPAFAIIIVGASLQAFVSPQGLGILRDATGSFVAGWYVMAAASVASFVGILLLKTK